MALSAKRFFRRISAADYTQKQLAALKKYRDLIHGAELTRMQEEYLRTLIHYVCENGDITPKVLQQQPFNKFTVIFGDSPQTLVAYVNMIGRVIVA